MLFHAFKSYKVSEEQEMLHLCLTGFYLRKPVKIIDSPNGEIGKILFCFFSFQQIQHLGLVLSEGFFERLLRAPSSDHDIAQKMFFLALEPSKKLKD